MTGTVTIAKGNSFDIRTIDFELIVDAFRARATNSGVAKKLLQNVDEFGMDMISAAKLSADEFKEFYDLLVEIRSEFSDRLAFTPFFDKLCQAAQTDARLSS